MQVGHRGPSTLRSGGPLRLSEARLDIFARDGFVGVDGILGGDLVDQGTPFAGRDKVQHLVAGILLARVALRWLGLGPLAVIGGVAITAVLWECVELARYLAWKRRGLGPWPAAADRMSWRDVVTTTIGALLAVALL